MSKVATTEPAACTLCQDPRVVFLDDLVVEWVTHHKAHERDRLFFCEACAAVFRPDPLAPAVRDAAYLDTPAEITAEAGWRRLAAYLEWNWLEKEWITTVAGDRLVRPPAGRVLDVGAKSGQAGFLFSLDGYQVDMLEPTKSWARFTERFLGIPTVQAYYEPEAFPPRRFDLIFAGGVVHRVEPPPRFFEAARRHLKPGGLLYCREPNLFNMNAAFFQDLHRAYFTPFAFVRLCERSGFEVLDWVDWSRDTRVPTGWNTAFSVLTRLTDGGPARPFAVARPSRHDVRLAITSAMLGIRMTEDLERKRIPATIGLWLRHACGVRLAYRLLGLYELLPRILRRLAWTVSVRARSR